MTEPNDLAPEPDAGVDLPDVQADDAGAEGFADDLRETLAESDGAETGEDDSARAYLEQAFGEAAEAEAKGAEQAKAATEWEGEHQSLYEQAIAAHGLTPEQAAQQGLTPQEATKRLYRAEQILKADPAAGFDYLVESYGANLDPTKRVEIAQRVLARLGFTHASQLGDQERAELQQWRAFQEQHRQAYRAELPKVHATIEQAANDRTNYPHFNQLEGMMAKIINAGLASDLPSAYDLAAKHAGLPARGVAARAAQQASVERAKAARTPRTSSVPVPVDDDADDNASNADILRAEFAKVRAAGRRVA
jgi:hypothetical protein